MTTKRRLEALELDADEQSRHQLSMRISAQRKLCCPMPKGATAAEHKAALHLMIKAQKCRSPTHAGWLAVRNYAIGLHRKYGGPFASEDLAK